MDAILEGDSTYMDPLPQFQRVAQFWWNQLYNIADHHKITNAISWHLKENYDNYKALHS
jgi:hypothetical protein